jgi:hypothetical protein
MAMVHFQLRDYKTRSMHSLLISLKIYGTQLKIRATSWLQDVAKAGLRCATQSNGAHRFGSRQRTNITGPRDFFVYSMTQTTPGGQPRAPAKPPGPCWATEAAVAPWSSPSSGA